MLSLALIFLHNANAVSKVTDNSLLNHVPMIMTHDAGSGYLGKGVVNRWTKTQDGGLKAQLDCGARAFDARPGVNSSGALCWHHGSVEVDYPLGQSLSDVVDWCGKNPTELVVLAFSDCEGSGCSQLLAKALLDANIPTITDCNDIKSMTFGQAKKRAHLASGGMLLALTGGGEPNGVACSYGNYHSDIACSGYQGIKEYSCWTGSKTASIPLNQMFSMFGEVNSKSPPADGLLWQTQALWQESASSVEIGTLKGSSLIIDEQKSGLNAMLVEHVQNGSWPVLNFLEVNDVCDQGLELLAAIKAEYYE
jgi:hypothetical protein